MNAEQIIIEASSLPLEQRARVVAAFCRH